MAMQAAMTGSKQHNVLNETMDRLESMAMAQAMAVAKFQKEMNGRMEMTEGMLMSQSHVASKAQKSIEDRITALEAMMMQSAMTAAKQNSQLASIMKLCTELSEQQGDSDSDSEDEEEFTLDAATIAKVKAAAYEKLAKNKGKTVEELKAEAKEMNAEEKAAMSAELRKLASKAVSRAHIKRTAGMELAAAKGFDSLEALEAHIKICPAEEKASLLAELNEMATKALESAAPRSGKALWGRAKVMIPFASAVKTLNDIPVALAKAVAAEDVDPSIVKCAATPIQVAVPMADAQVPA